MIPEVLISYINQSSGNETTASVTVEETGQFHITIFAIREETGILDSNIEYRGEVKLFNKSNGMNKHFQLILSALHFYILHMVAMTHLHR